MTEDTGPNERGDGAGSHGTRGDARQTQGREAHPAEAPPDGPESVEYKLKKRPMWPFLAVVLLLAGGITAAVLHFVNKPEPLRVLVVIDLEGTPWEGSVPAAKLTDAVSQHLENVGFDPVKTGDPEIEKIVTKAKTPLDAAKKLKAAFVVEAHLSPKIVEEKVGNGYFEVRVDAPITVRHIDDPDDKVAEGHVSSWSGAETKDKALELIAGSLADMVFDEAAPRLMAHPNTKAVLDGDDIHALERIQKAKGFVSLRQKRLDGAAKAYAELDAQRAATPQKIRKITYHGTAAESDLLAGAGPDGFLVQTVDVTPFVSPKSVDLDSITRLERLEWRSFDGKTPPKVVWSGYHLYGYPTSAGNSVVFVEDIFGWAKTVTVVAPDGKANRVRVDPNVRFVDPKISPDGKAAALYAKPCRNCASSFMIVSLVDGTILYDRKSATDEPGIPSTEIYGGYTWIDDSKAVLLVKPRVDPGALVITADEKEKGKPSYTLDVLTIDVGGGSAKVERVAGFDANEVFQWPTPSPDKKTIAIAHGTTSGSDIALVDLTNGKLLDLHAGGGCQDPVFSPDGASIAYDEGGNIHLVHVADSKTEDLTENDIEERYPLFSPDNKHVYFESVGQDPNFRRRRVAVIASVEVNP